MNEAPFLHKIPSNVSKVRSTLCKSGKDIDLSKPPEANLAAFVRARGEDPQFKDQVFLEVIDESKGKSSNKREKFTFFQFEQETNQFANLLQEFGFQKGSSMGFIGENISAMHISYIGTGKVGGLCAPLNPKDSLEKWRLTFQDCKVQLIVVQEKFFNEKFFDLVNDLPFLKGILLITQGEIPSHSDFPCPIQIFSEKIREQSSTFSPPNDLTWDLPYLLVYTSGTTGTPKGVVITAETIWRCANSLNQHFGFGPKDTTFAQLSGFHVNHIVVSFWGPLAGGYRCFMSNCFRAEKYFQKIVKEKITISSVVPTNLAYALKAELEGGSITSHPDFHKKFLNHFIEHFSEILDSNKIKAAWNEALGSCKKIVDPVKFQKNFLEDLKIQIKSPHPCLKTFDEDFRKAFGLGFAKNFQPPFETLYSLSPKKIRIICGAGDLAMDLALNFSRITGLQITQGWGMSEGTCYNTMNPSPQSWLLYWITLGSIGLEMDTTNMSIIATNQELKPVQKEHKLVYLSPKEMALGKVGMMVMRGHVSFLGYYNNDKANEESFIDDWMLTGDAGNALMLSDSPGFKTFIRDCRTISLAELIQKYPKIEERFYPLLKKVRETGNSSIILQILEKESPLLKKNPLYYIKGRIKDIIITKGQNIPCDEIETGVLQHPGVFEAVAVGILDVQDGEVPGLVCTLHPKATLSAEEIQKFCCNRKVLPRIQWPAMVAIVKNLPKTPTGKYQRIRAREVFMQKELKPGKTPKYEIEITELCIFKDYDPERRPSI